MSYEVLFNQFQLDYELAHNWDSYSSLWQFNGTSWKFLEEHEDAYELMFSFSCVGYFKQAMLVTYGWASPISKSHTPSKHPDKKRVRVCVHLSNEKFVTSMQIQGDSELVIQQDDLEGNLIDVARNHLNNVKKYFSTLKNISSNSL